MGFLGSIVAAILQVVFTAIAGWRRDKDRVDTHERAAKAEAETQTQTVIAEISDAQKQAPVGGSADDISERLLGKRRHFGNPGRHESGDKG
jgi:hypothetical protein